MHYRHNDTTRENGRHHCTKFETSQKNQPPHTGCATTSQFNQSKNNRYQQTWHTIEFSNNRNVRLLAGPAFPRFHGLLSFAVVFTAYFILFSLVKSSALAYSLQKDVRQDNPMTIRGLIPNRFRAHGPTASFLKGLVALTGATP